ncbi:MAG: uroporphyrinogen decarboxylase, partial [Planctomycetota bacterium]
MQRLIEKYNGVAHVSPSMREVAIDPNRQAIDFAYNVITGQIGVVVLMTGVGFRFLMRAIEKHVDAQQFLDALSDIITIARGPKPVAAMREFGLRPTHRVPAPNTWRELLQTIDQDQLVLNQTVGLQEYGNRNASLVAGLEARGAKVVPLRVYAYEFPQDVSSLRGNIDAVCCGHRDVAMFTSAHQVVNVLRMAGEMNCEEQFRQQMERMIAVSIGPTTTEAMQEAELRVDLSPQHPKMGHMVVDAARRAPLLARRRGLCNMGDSPTQTETPKGRRTLNLQQSENSDRDDGRPRHESDDSLFMRAARGMPTTRTPIWMMRQAGRYMAEYREVRAGRTFLDLCEDPAMCSEVMCTAVDRLGVDAAIIFSDLLPLLRPLGFDLKFVAGDGPVIDNPIRGPEDLSRVHRLDDVSSMGFVFETVRKTRQDLPSWMPLIGFSGSPFTLASYAIEGGGSRQYPGTKRMMHAQPQAFADLLHLLSDAVIAYLNQQIAAGAQCVQLFDSWVGCLSPSQYVRHVLPHMKHILANITPGVPVINFGTGNPELLPLMRGDYRTVVGVDWRIPLDIAWQRIGFDRPVQGNLDQSVLLSDEETIAQAVRDVLSRAGQRPGHIFNLGHGIMKETPVENA